MSNQAPHSLEQAKAAVTEQFWLLYFNKTLYEKGLITEQQRNRMIHLIKNRKSGSAGATPGCGRSSRS